MVHRKTNGYASDLGAPIGDDEKELEVCALPDSGKALPILHRGKSCFKLVQCSVPGSDATEAISFDNLAHVCYNLV